VAAAVAVATLVVLPCPTSADHADCRNLVRDSPRVPAGHRQCVGEGVVEQVELRQDDRAAQCAARSV